jgi:SH3 domain protein|tara:strand:- start:15272 stop:15934 length:663 start_codon:yes stop_codon:yes gene_type:complete
VKKILFALSLIAGSSLAETAFISDELDIMVRSGESSSHRIIATLKSGKKVNILERNPDSGYSKVKLSDTRDGWVLSRLLVSTPSAKSQLKKLQSQLINTQQEAAEAKEKLASLSEQNLGLDTRTSELEQLNTRLSRELEDLKNTASNAVEILQQRDLLQQRVVTIERELERFKRENDVLKNSDSQDWFLMGAAVLALGLLLGFILPKLSWRRKSSWQSSF